MKYSDMYVGDTLVRRDGTSTILLSWDRDRKYDNATDYPQTVQSTPILIQTSEGKEWLTESLNVVDGHANDKDVILIEKANGRLVEKPLLNSTQAILDMVASAKAQVTVEVDSVHGWVTIKAIDPSVTEEVFLQGYDGLVFVRTLKTMCTQWDISKEDAQLFQAYEYLDLIFHP